MRRIDRDLVEALICSQFAYQNLRASVLEDEARPYTEVFQFVQNGQTFASIAKAVGATVLHSNDGTDRFSHNGCVFVHRRDRVEVA